MSQFSNNTYKMAMMLLQSHSPAIGEFILNVRVPSIFCLKRLFHSKPFVIMNHVGGHSEKQSKFKLHCHCLSVGKNSYACDTYQSKIHEDLLNSLTKLKRLLCEVKVSQRRHHISFASTNLFSESVKSNNTVHSRGFADKADFKDILNVLQQTGRLNETPFSQTPRLRKSNLRTTKKEVEKYLQSKMFTKEEAESNASPMTVEKQLLFLMQMWETEKAVVLLQESVKMGVNPDRTVILDLLQQLANLGEVDCLLELHEFLKDHNLTSNLRFYHCLRDAYFNSGRIEDGMVMLRMIYHSTREFSEADMFFTLLATMTIKYFGHHTSLIEEFVNDLQELDPPVPHAKASLWKCFVLAEEFAQADQMLEENEELKKMLPAQVTLIIQSQLQMDYDREKVLLWLMDLPYIKARLKASVFDALILHKCSAEDWSDALEYLLQALDIGLQIRQDTVKVFLTKFFSQLSDLQTHKLEEWANTLDNGDDQAED